MLTDKGHSVLVGQMLGSSWNQNKNKGTFHYQ
jgi:hypothetical protein